MPTHHRPSAFTLNGTGPERPSPGGKETDIMDTMDLWAGVPLPETREGRLCVVAQGSPAAGRAEELAASLLAHLAASGQSVSRRDVVTVPCQSWQELKKLPERAAPLILQAIGLRPRFTGLLCVDLRRWRSAPPADALDGLLDFLAPLGQDAGVLLLCRDETVSSLCQALAPLEPAAAVLEREPAVPFAPRRMIGFAREEEER